MEGVERLFFSCDEVSIGVSHLHQCVSVAMVLCTTRTRCLFPLSMTPGCHCGGGNVAQADQTKYSFLYFCLFFYWYEIVFIHNLLRLNLCCREEDATVAASCGSMSASARQLAALRAVWATWETVSYSGEPPIHSKCVGFALPSEYYAVYKMNRDALKVNSDVLCTSLTQPMRDRDVVSPNGRIIYNMHLSLCNISQYQYHILF